MYKQFETNAQNLNTYCDRFWYKKGRISITKRQKARDVSGEGIIDDHALIVYTANLQSNLFWHSFSLIC